MEITGDVSVQVTAPAVAEQVGLVRHAISGVLTDSAVPDSTALDVLLALDAMCSVVIASSGESRRLRCVCTVGDDCAELQVTGHLLGDVALVRRGYAWRLLDRAVEGLMVATNDDGVVQLSGRKAYRSNG